MLQNYENLNVGGKEDAAAGTVKIDVIFCNLCNSVTFCLDGHERKKELYRADVSFFFNFYIHHRNLSLLLAQFEPGRGYLMNSILL